MPGTSHSLPIAAESQLEAVAAELAKQLKPPLVVYLEGELGAGKTTFVRALLRALGYPGRVKSPTYGLLELYELEALSFLHLDLYRVENPRELEYLAIRDQLNPQTVLAVEWPSRGGGALPPADVLLSFAGVGEDRMVNIVSRTEVGATVLDGLKEQFPL